MPIKITITFLAENLPAWAREYLETMVESDDPGTVQWLADQFAAFAAGEDKWIKDWMIGVDDFDRDELDRDEELDIPSTFEEWMKEHVPEIELRPIHGIDGAFALAPALKPVYDISTLPPRGEIHVFYGVMIDDDDLDGNDDAESEGWFYRLWMYDEEGKKQLQLADNDYNGPFESKSLAIKAGQKLWRKKQSYAGWHTCRGCESWVGPFDEDTGPGPYCATCWAMMDDDEKEAIHRQGVDNERIFDFLRQLAQSEPSPAGGN